MSALAVLALLRSRWREGLGIIMIMMIAGLYLAFRHEQHRAGVAEGKLSALVAQERAAAEKAKRVVAAEAQVSSAAEKREAAAQVQIRTVTQTIIQKVPVYVDAQTDARFPLPWGLLRVYDASLWGVDVSAVPIPAGQSDGSASPVKASDAAAVLAGNNGECRATAERLTALQDWISAVQAASLSH